MANRIASSAAPATTVRTAAAISAHRVAYVTGSPAYPAPRDNRMVRAQRNWCRHAARHDPADSRVLTTTFEIEIAQTERMQLAAELIIVGEVIGDGCESADAFQIRSSERQR